MWRLAPLVSTLTLNALVNACNQCTNRDPVMHLDQAAAEAALVRLQCDRLVFQVKPQSSRTLKYEHNLKAVADFSDRELAIVCVIKVAEPSVEEEILRAVMPVASQEDADRDRTALLWECAGLNENVVP